MRSSNAAMDSLCELWGFDDDTLVSYSLRAARALRITPRDPLFLSDATMGQIAYSEDKMLRLLPDGYGITAVCAKIRSPEERLRQYAQNLGHDPLAQKIALKRVEGLYRDRVFYEPEYYIFIESRPFVRPDALWSFSGLSSAKAITAWRERRRYWLAELERATNAALSALNSAGLGTRKLAKAELWETLWALANPVLAQDYTAPSYDENKALNAQLYRRSSKVSIDSYVRAGKHNAVVTLETPPKVTRPDSAQEITRLDMPHILSVSLRKEKQQEYRDKLKLRSKRTRRIVQFLAGRKGVAAWREEHDKADLKRIDEVDLLRSDLAADQSAFRARMSVWTCADSPSELKSRIDAIKSQGLEMGESKWATEEFTPTDAFVSMLPLQESHEAERQHITTSRQAACLIPVFGEDLGDPSPFLLLKTRGGGLYGYNPSRPSLKNKNSIVIGPSGSGKSFITRIERAGWVSDNRRLCVMTRGRDYAQFARSYGGAHLDVYPGAPGLALNFIPTSTGWRETKNQGEDLLVMTESVVLLATEDGVKFSRAHKAEINRLLRRYLEDISPKDKTLPGFVEFLATTEVEQDVLKELAPRLRYWTEGPYRDAFLQRPDLIDAKVVVWDLERAGKPEEQAALMGLLEYTVKRIAARYEIQLIVDEAKAALKTSVGVALIEELFNQARKRGYGITAIFQSVLQFLSLDPALRAAVNNNSDTRIILPPGEDDLREISKAYGFSSREEMVTGSLECVPYQWSEVLIKAGNHRQIVRLEPNTFETWHATSHKPHAEQIDALHEQYPHLSEVERLEILEKEGVL